MNNEYGDPISFYIAEVVSIVNKETFTLKTQRDSKETPKLHHVYEIDCKIITSNVYSPVINDIKPADINSKKIPVVGEQVLLFKGYREDSNIDSLKNVWYYLTTLSVNSNVNFNALTGLTTNLTNNTFNEKEISVLQAHPGDVIIEGRWGNSIRFGGSIDTKTKLEVTPNFQGSNNDPIIILSNRTKNDKEIITENVQDDESSLYLTSKQTISNFTLGSKANRNSLKYYSPGESQFANSQLIGIADRIILKAKTDIAVIDSEKAIILNTTGEIKLGNDTASESMVHGDVLLNVLQKILNQLSSPIQCGTMSGTFIDKSNINSAQRLLQKLLSSTYFIDKNTY